MCIPGLIIILQSFLVSLQRDVFASGQGLTLTGHVQISLRNNTYMGSIIIVFRMFCLSGCLVFEAVELVILMARSCVGFILSLAVAFTDLTLYTLTLGLGSWSCLCI